MSVAVWRAWAEAAPPELRREFDMNSLECVRTVRRDYPPDCGPNHPQYLEMRNDCTAALDKLSERIERDALHQNQ